MLAKLKQFVFAAIAIAGIYGLGAKDASAANIWMNYIYFHNSSVIYYGGGFSIVGDENTPSITGYSYGSTGQYWPCSTMSVWYPSWDATVACDWRASNTTCYAWMQYYWHGGQYHIYTSYDLFH